jgi:HD-GYP domain-containing protein (c-di-GMP phosphodiesterase class II)
MSRWWFPGAARITGAYAAFSIVWILVGDRLADGAARGDAYRLSIEDAKGLLFVALSSLLIYVLVSKSEAHRRRSSEAQQAAYDETLMGWAAALDVRDHSTAAHTARVTALTEQLACSIGISGHELVRIRRGATLHDIGKMGVPDEILRKEGPLTDDEWVLMRQHPDLAVQFLSGVNYLRDALDIPWCHHEKWDGSGYPRGLAGTDIPLPARLFAVIDVYDAVTSDRPYRRALPHDDVMTLIHDGKGSHFDPDVVDAFDRLMDAEPTLRHSSPVPL